MVWKKSIFIKRNNKIKKDQRNCWYLFAAFIFQDPRWTISFELFDSYSHGALNVIWLVKKWARLLLVLRLRVAIEFAYCYLFCFYWLAYLCFSEILLTGWVAWKRPYVLTCYYIILISKTSFLITYLLNARKYPVHRWAVVIGIF